MALERTILLLTGTKAGGKGAIAEVLQNELNFAYESLSTRVREEAARRGTQDAPIRVLQDIGNELRGKFGGDILARLTAAKLFLEQSSNIVIDGVRNPDEVRFFKNVKGYRVTVVAVDAPQDLRWKYMQNRARPSDPKTYEEFLVVDARDQGEDGNPLGQQVGACMHMADALIMNDGTKKDLADAIRLSLAERLHERTDVRCAPLFASFREAFLYNISNRSRTAHGTSDVSVSGTKKPLLLSGDALERQVHQNTEQLARAAWDARDKTKPTPRELRELLEQWFRIAMKDIAHEDPYKEERAAIANAHRSANLNPLYRVWEVPYGGKITPGLLEDVMDKFYSMLASIISNFGPPSGKSSDAREAEVLGWADMMLDGWIHPWHDACSRVSTALVMWLALIHPNRRLPRFRTKKEHYRTIQDLKAHTAYFEECLKRIR